MRLTIRFVVIACLLVPLSSQVFADELDDLAKDFWRWRAENQPITEDDIPRIDHPADWTPQWSKTAVEERQKALKNFQLRWLNLNAEASQWPVARSVDLRLMGSAISRVNWEMNFTRGWQRNPSFYVDQTVAAVFDRMLQPPPFDRVRSAELLRRLQAIPRVLEEAKANLEHPARPFAELALAQLKDIRQRLTASMTAVKPLLASESAASIDGATKGAIEALENYRSWLEQKLPGMETATAVGRDGFEYFLREVALMPYTPEQILVMGRQEWDRSVAFETYEKQRNTGLPILKLFPDQAAQLAREEKDEQTIRDLMEKKGILSVPAWAKHYRNLPLPAYLEPLEGMGVTDDLTSSQRLNQNGTSYIRRPSPRLGFFSLSTARDPRPIILHEGVPGHYFQKIISWSNDDPIRRYYYDSGANEGIGFYAEEMMMQAGLFDDSPRSRELIYSFMRLRALRVEADVKLALGQYTIEQAADYLMKTVPVDRGTGLEDAAMYAATPGLGISYQTGKLQIMKFLTEARAAEGPKFSLRRFHDYVWKNGNVPIAEQQREYMDNLRRQ